MPEDKCGEAASLPIRIDTVDRGSPPTGAPTNQPPASDADSSALAWLLGSGLVLWIALLILLAVCCSATVVFSTFAVIFLKIRSNFAISLFDFDFFLLLLIVYFISL